MGIIEEMQDLQRKAERYNVLKENIDKTEKYLEEISELMIKARQSLNPVSMIKERKERKSIVSQSGGKAENKIALEEQFNKLKMGIYVSKDTLIKDYPHWDDMRCSNFIQQHIKYIPKIQSRKKESSKVNQKEYFLDNTI